MTVLEAVQKQMVNPRKLHFLSATTHLTHVDKILLQVEKHEPKAEKIAVGNARSCGFCGGGGGGGGGGRK